MIVNQPNALNQEQNQYPSIFDEARRVLLQLEVFRLAILLAVFIIFVFQNILIHFYSKDHATFWIIAYFFLHAIGLFLDVIALAISGDTKTYVSMHRFCLLWVGVLTFQVLNVVCYTVIWIVWIYGDGISMTSIKMSIIVLSWVRFAIFIVVFSLSIVLYRKLQGFDNATNQNHFAIRYSNFEPGIVALNTNGRGQVVNVGRRPQNQDYLVQHSDVVSENLSNDLPPKYEDLGQPPTYEAYLLHLQQQQ